MNRKTATFCAALAAALYALSAPVSKLLLVRLPSTMMAALLYLGAGAGMAAVGAVQRRTGAAQREQPLTRRELPYTLAMVLLDVAAPILLMLGIARTTAANASLLNNFEIVATSLIALAVFREAISKRLWIGIALVTLSSMILSVEDASSFSFSAGSVLVLMACVCWGFENNCTRMLSAKNPLEIVVIKGLCSGGTSLCIALALGERLTAADAPAVIGALLLGFVAYGLSIFFYIYAQRGLGAARTSAYYAVAPFIGVALSMLLCGERPGAAFFIALAVMATGTYFASIDPA